MMNEIIDKFKEKYESLAGKVYYSNSVDQTIQFIGQIMQDNSPENVALVDISSDIVERIKVSPFMQGIGILNEPFEASTLPNQIDKATVGISSAKYAIAETGTIIEVSTNDAIRLVSTLPLVHIALVNQDTIFPTLDDATDILNTAFNDHSKNCVVSFISGPSRTGDIEMKLTLGVHGPKESHVIVYKDSHD